MAVSTPSGSAPGTPWPEARTNEMPSTLIRISKIGSRYLLFSVSDVMTVRRCFNMCSVFTGTTPLSPAQNAFLSLPLELMVEEAKLLVQKGAAYVVDDKIAHTSYLSKLTPDERYVYCENLRSKRQTVEHARAEEKKKQREELLKQKMLRGQVKGKKNKGRKGETLMAESDTALGIVSLAPVSGPVESENPLFFAAPSESSSNGGRNSIPQIPLTITKLSITPTPSVPDLLPHPKEAMINPSGATSLAASEALIHNVPKSFPLYVHLHEQGYYMTPGLRFGANYSVYPGDPMRFHAHFLASAFDWDEPISMLDIVGPGRLATSVKKGFVIAGEAPLTQVEGSNENEGNRNGRKEKITGEEIGDRVRAFSIEWAGM